MPAAVSDDGAVAVTPDEKVKVSDKALPRINAPKLLKVTALVIEVLPSKETA